MIGHARWLLWEGYSEGYLKHSASYSVLNKGLMYLFSCFAYGHEVVLFFFVLSGFVIHLRFSINLGQSGSSGFTFANYFRKRAKRIYPPFITAIFLTLLLDSIGKKIGLSIYSGTTAYSLINENIGNRDLSFKSFAGNLLFLYTEYVPVYGSNGPAWSLKYEWWFYMLYPIFLLMAKKKILYPTLIMIALFFASFFPRIWPENLLRDVFSIMITWWLGVILAEVYSGRIRVPLKYLAGFMLFILLIPYAKRFENVIYDLTVAFCFLGLLAFFLSLNSNNKLIRFIATFKPLGDFSYTLYIVHFPILVFMSGLVMQKNGGQLPAHFGYVAVGILITTVVAYILHFITELPFTRPKQKIALQANAKASV
jgi:peptidoglycan/LPS O-acetylase OafA/YrhL